MLWFFPKYCALVAGGAAAAIIIGNGCGDKTGGSGEAIGGAPEWRVKSSAAASQPAATPSASQPAPKPVPTGRQWPTSPAKSNLRKPAPRQPFGKTLNQKPKFGKWVQVPGLSWVPDYSDGTITPAEMIEFQTAYHNEPMGTKQEAAVREMFNKYVKTGKFIDYHGDSQLLSWLYRLDANGVAHYLDYDGYNADDKLAFEYQGPGHYKSSPNPTKQKQFINGRANDKIKESLASLNGVHLIKIPYTIPEDQIANYVKSRLADVKALKDGVEHKYIPEAAEPPIEAGLADDIQKTININVEQRMVIGKAAAKVPTPPGFKPRPDNYYSLAGTSAEYTPVSTPVSTPRASPVSTPVGSPARSSPINPLGSALPAATPPAAAPPVDVSSLPDYSLG
ncbi:MAG: hypothetical protein WDA28_13035 [Castellaniella sp.]